MKKLFYGMTAVFTLLLAIILLAPPQTVNAADIRTGNNVILSGDQNLKDLYLFGNIIDITSPVNNDLVAAGGTLNLNGDISNDLLAAGGTIIVRGKVGNTARIAGGNITVDGPVARDLVVAGGNVTVDRTASVGGDVLVAGGQLDLEGPVHGKILVSGGNLTLNNTVSGSVSARRIGTLTLGPQAKINGNLTYSSPQQLTRDPGSVVVGKTTYHQVEKQQNKQQSASAWFGFSFYQLLVEIIISLLLIYFLKGAMMVLVTKMKEGPWKGLGIGFVYVLLAPIVSLILLILFPLGIASFLLYVFVLILSIFLRDIFAGWLIMHWWDTRNKKNYLLDWKAGVIGPIVMLLINLIPVLGWLISAIICLIGIGAVSEIVVGLLPQLQTITKKK